MNRNKRAYWVWLQQAFGAGSPKPAYIAKRFPCLAEFYEGGRSLWSEFRFVSEKEVAALTACPIERAAAQIEYAEKMGQQVFTPQDEDYPNGLRNIEDAPAVLYVKGELPDFDNFLSIAVVGARKATEGALKTAKLLSYELSKSGAIVVSGGALGVDAAAHRGALMGASPTACVLGCGIDYPYLMENQMLRNRIVENGGALITEYPVNTGVNKGVFAVRNRIISGLSHGLLVIEAAQKGGTMLTVRHATRQNRDLYAVPGDLHNPLAEGCNALIADGVKPVRCAEDILEEYRYRFQKATATVLAPISMPSTQPLPKGLSENAAAVFSCLTQKPTHASEIMEKTTLRPSQILTAATELELMGHIRSYSGQRFSLK